MEPSAWVCLHERLPTPTHKTKGTLPIPAFYMSLHEVAAAYSISPGVGKVVGQLPEIDTKEIFEDLVPDLNGDPIIAHGRYSR